MSFSHAMFELTKFLWITSVCSIQQCVHWLDIVGITSCYYTLPVIERIATHWRIDFFTSKLICLGTSSREWLYRFNCQGFDGQCYTQQFWKTCNFLYFGKYSEKTTKCNIWVMKTNGRKLKVLIVLKWYNPLKPCHGNWIIFVDKYLFLAFTKNYLFLFRFTKKCKH